MYYREFALLNVIERYCKNCGDWLRVHIFHFRPESGNVEKQFDWFLRFLFAVEVVNCRYKFEWLFNPAFVKRKLGLCNRSASSVVS